MRHGITPLIAILLLLMMTVAAAGAAFLWMNQLQEDVQSETGQDIRKRTTTTVTMISLSCYNQGDRGLVETILANQGNTQLELEPVSMNVRTSNDAELDTEMSPTGLSLSQEDLKGASWTDTDVKLVSENDLEQPGTRGFYNLTTGKGSEHIFDPGTTYSIEFVFIGEDGFTKRGECTAFRP